MRRFWLVLALAGCASSGRYYYGDYTVSHDRGYTYGYYTPGPYYYRGPVVPRERVVVAPRYTGIRHEVRDYFRHPKRPFDHRHL
jgi:hypothetical protein